MTALAKDRNTQAKYTERTILLKVAASTKIYAGSLVSVNPAGYAIPADKTTAGQVVRGVADEYIDNSSGSNGDLSVRVSVGVFGFVNDGNAIAQADIGKRCFVVDDQTVADETEGSDVVAGVVDSIGGDGFVYVRLLDGEGLVHGVETVTSGALSLYKRTSLISVTGTAAYTLAAGLYEGQRKSIYVTVAASTPDGTLTPATFADGTSLDLDAVSESAELEYHATGGWQLVALVGATINA